MSLGWTGTHPIHTYITVPFFFSKRVQYSMLLEYVSLESPADFCKLSRFTGCDGQCKYSLKDLIM